MGIRAVLGRGVGSAKSAWGSQRSQNIRGGAKTVGQKSWGGAKTVASGGASLMGGVASGIGGIASKKPSGATFFVILGFLLFLFDVMIDYKGFYITEVDPLGLVKAIMSFGYIVGVWALFFLLVSKDKSPKVIASAVVVIIVLMISAALAVRYNPIAIIHVFYILILWFFFIRGNEEATQSNNLLLMFLFVDLYLFSILNVFSPAAAEFLVGFPILFLATMFYVYDKTNNKLALTFIFLAFAWYFLMGGPAFADNLGLAGIEGEIEKLPWSDWGEFWKISKKELLVAPFQKVAEAGGAWLNQRIQYAITGQVEENQYEPLGVYLENVQSADPKYYEGEDVIIWGTVKARTLDEPVYIKVGCYVEDDEDEDKKIYTPDVDPIDTFPVFTLEDNDFACTFGTCPESKSECESVKLETGSSNVKASAEFNFETLAYLKVYFINKDRQRAMVREGLDIFKEFDIKDKAPISIYTNGPVDLAMETTTPLIGIADEYAAHPALDIGLTNRAGWGGEIIDLRELVLFFPEGITLTDCNKKFDDYKITNCQDSCTKVETECDNICKDSGGCGTSCQESKTKCDDTCTSLLVEGKYNGYSLNIGSLEQKDPEKFKLFRCRFKPNANKVLGNAPLATKFFRVKARYNYKIEEDVSVKITDPYVAPPKYKSPAYCFDENNNVQLDWYKSADDGSGVDDVTGYKIYRTKEGEEVIEIDEGPKSSEYYRDMASSLDVTLPATKYYYKVEVIDDAGNKADTGDVEVVYDPSSDTCVEHPKYKSPAYCFEDGKVRLMWEKSGDDDVTGYKIYRTKEGDEVMDPIINGIPKETGNYLDDSSLVEGDKYFYKVEVIDGAGNKADTGDVEVIYEPTVESKAC
jgi:hypothetical protein